MAVPHKAKTIFLNAVEIASPVERRAYVTAECAGDDALGHEVAEFLQYHEGMGSFLETSGPGPCGTVDLPVPASPVNTASPPRISIPRCISAIAAAYASPA